VAHWNGDISIEMSLAALLGIGLEVR
jgi:hypothetical protein